MTALHIAAALNRNEIATFIIKYVTNNMFKQVFVQDIISKINSEIHLSPLSMAILSGNKQLAILLI
jgi:hypothetical protein